VVEANPALERWAVAVGDDGQIVVDKSKKFQQERGEWSNPESFIKV
jgi:cytochrome b6-f complex iron-sulfur subunit